MKNDEKKVDFDLAVLSLSELVTLYEKINGFVEFLDSSVIEDKKGVS